VGSYEIDPALAELCRREHVRLVGLLALYTGDRAVGEDLAAYRRLGATRSNMPGPEPSDVVAVRSAVVALLPRQRAALVLRYYGGLSLAETAETLGCAEGTVKSLTTVAC
jgi:DNA-directed RNA polymerase specialized sigma24 family protein